MSRTKWSLSPDELRRYRSLVKRMNDGGAGLDMSAFWTENALEVRTIDCYARRVQCGAVYVLFVSIVSIAQKTILREFGLTSHEFELGAYFVDDPRVNRSINETYYLLDGTRFCRDEVLNHRVGAEGMIRRGDEVEGFFLAQSFEPFPERYEPASRLPVILSIVDQFGDVTHCSIDLCVQLPFLKARSPRRRRSVFEEPVPPIRDGRRDSPFGSDMPVLLPDILRACASEDRHESTQKDSD